MASWKLVAVSVAVVACFVTFSSAQLLPQPVRRMLGCPGAPWCPVWVKCNYTELPGSSCHDCTTRVVCTPAGRGLLRPCNFLGLKHCANGKCQSKPTAACTTEAPTEATEAPTEATEAPTETTEAPVEFTTENSPTEASKVSAEPPSEVAAPSK